MSVKTKILSIITLTLICLSLFSYAAGHKIILGNFERIEKHLVYDNLGRIVNALNEDLNNLSSFTRDWSRWDDTYDFIISRNSGYIKSNLPDSTFVISNLQIVVYLNSAGEVIYGTKFDRNKEAQIPLSKSFTEHLGTNSIFLEAMTGTPVAGLLPLPEGIMHIVSESILTSEDKGPSRGVLIMGRFLDKTYIDKLGKRTHLSLDMNPIGQQELDSDFYEAKIKIDKNKTKYVTQILNPNIIAGYTILRDISGQSALMFRVNNNREIYYQGNSSLDFLLLILTITGLIIGIIIVVLIQYNVTGRISKLSIDVNGVRTQKEKASMLQYTGDDEISSLTKDINSMLSALYKSNADAKKQKKIAEQASLAKSEFLSSMSHELRTPLNAILGFSQVLELDKDTLTENQNSAVQYILAGGYHLLHLVNEVLDLAKIESGTFECNVEKISLKETMTQCSILMNTLAEESNIQINYGNPQDYMIVADSQRIKQVLINYLSNAIKYNCPNGNVTINYQTVEENRLRINVTDTGIGINDSDLEMLFQPFTRVGDKSTNIQGTGTGLVISKELMTLMDGTVGASSVVGEGSTFWLEIKLDE